MTNTLFYFFCHNSQLAIVFYRFYQTFNGESIQELSWMLDVVLPALVDTCLTGMSLPCLLHPKMSMKLRYSLRWSVGFLLFWQWLEHKSFPSLIIHLMWSTVQGVGSTGMLMASTLEHCYILLYYSLFYSIQNCWLILFYTISCNVWDTCVF